MGNNYVAVIETICDKLGIAASEAAKLIPEIINRGICVSATCVGISLVLIILGVTACFIAVRSMGKLNRCSDYTGWFNCYGAIEVVLLIVAGVAILGGVIAFFSNLYSLVSWLSGPNSSAIAWIVSQF